eukprot:1513352-Rhodomonas_salina.2
MRGAHLVGFVRDRSRRVDAEPVLSLVIRFRCCQSSGTRASLGRALRGFAIGLSTDRRGAVPDANPLTIKDRVDAVDGTLGQSFSKPDSASPTRT